MKVGDMVMLVEIDNDSTAYLAGLRIGAIGTIVAPNFQAVLFFPDRFEVYFPEHTWNVIAPPKHLRLIPPPERCDADFDWRRVGEDETISA